MLKSAGLVLTVLLVADRDATLIEQADGALANGAAPLVFSGQINRPPDLVRRGLFHFDLTDSRRSDGPVALVSATLILTNDTSANVEPREYRLHRVLADWTEGPSYSSGGLGSPSEAGDVTWIHSSYPDRFWLHAGAQFAGEPSARAIVAGPGVYRFEGPGLLRDLAYWYAHPDENFGWILIGDETTHQTVRAFVSRESALPSARPTLELTFRAVSPR